jgi:hypothetical protein
MIRAIWYNADQGVTVVTSPNLSLVEDSGLTEREYMTREMDKKSPGVEFRLVDDREPAIAALIGSDTVTPDRMFRDALEDKDGRLGVNMPKARSIHMDRIRQVRDSALAALDVPWMKAVESGNVAEQQRIVRQKQALRDIPVTFPLDIYTDTGSLKAAWPKDL